MTTPDRDPADVALWRDAVRETSALENLRPHDGLIRQILLGPDTLEFTRIGGEVFTAPASADRNVIASAASKTLGRKITANQAAEWEPPEQTVNYWWAETLYNFGLLAPEGIVMNPTVVFTRIWREGTIAKIEAYDARRTAVAEFDLRADHPPADTVTDVLEALRV